MTRLIDADALKKEFSEGAFTSRGVREIIDNEPTVEERRQGEWIYHKNWEYDGECPWECSKCGTCYDYDMNFCGNCGADMRGGQGNDPN